MYAFTHTVAIRGIEPQLIKCEVQLSKGLPGIQIVGLPSKLVGESKERIRSALASVGLGMPAKRVTVNLAPAHLRKEGSHYDLPIAVALLMSMGALPPQALESQILMGELGLDGGIKGTPGTLVGALAAKEHGFSLVCSVETASEAAWLRDVQVFQPLTLLEFTECIRNRRDWPRAESTLIPPNPPPSLPFQGILGQEKAKRALIIAATGFHNLLFNGPPGSGKSILAARLQHLLPPPSAKDVLETSQIYSVGGYLRRGLVRQRPFRAPHHTISTAAMIGGGHPIRPGEISLSHAGVLFMDEMPEFSRPVLDALRQPLETHKVLIARAQDHVTYPARFLLVGAMNPCRCGEELCERGPNCKRDYEARISAPIYDRIDLFVYTRRLPQSELRERSQEESPFDCISAALECQHRRYRGLPFHFNGLVSGDLVEQHMPLEPQARSLLEKSFDRLHLSMRAYHKTLRLARTIADLDLSPKIHREHVAEAISYRR